MLAQLRNVTPEGMLNSDFWFDKIIINHNNGTQYTKLIPK